MTMQRAGFSVGTLFQQSGVPFALILGVFWFGETADLAVWSGIGLVTAGLVLLSWPARGARFDLTSVALGTFAGFCFALCANFFRQAGLRLEPNHPVAASIGTLVLVQLIQTVSLGSVLAVRDPSALRAVLGAWRLSWGAGLFGAAASAGWFTALTLVPAGFVRAVGTVEIPIAALAGKRLFKETPTGRQWLASVLIAGGAIICATHHL